MRQVSRRSATVMKHQSRHFSGEPHARLRHRRYRHDRFRRVAELLANGHTVLALARSDSSEQTLKDAGAEVLRGGLADVDVLRAGAAQSDGVISLAFSPDYDSADGLAAAITEESAALAALGQELIGSDRPIVTVSGTPWVAGRASTENDPLPLEGPVAGRARSVNALLDLASRGVRATAVRMPRKSTTRARADLPAC